MSTRWSEPRLEARLMMRSLGKLAGVLLGMACAGLCAPAQAGKSDDTLRAALQIEIANLDTYYDSAGSVVVMTRHIWDALYYIDPETSELRPALAEAHKFIDESTLEIDLRKGVKFHDGHELTADDVVYTLNWIRNPQNKVRTITSTDWIGPVEKLDQYKVRINMAEPTALALRFLSVFPIYPAGTYDKNGVAAMNLNPIGTGPYRVATIEAGKRYVLKRFNEHYAQSPKGQASIENLIVRIVPEAGTQIAEMMSGGLDWIYMVSSDQAEQLKRNKNLAVESKPTSRMMYMVMDAAGRTGENSPFKKLLVRKAVSHAIDRQGIVSALVQGGAKVLNAFCFPQDFGCPSDVVKYNYDPKLAKTLLTEAGYPNGFSITVSAWRDRSYVEAIMGNLNAVGIKTTLNYSNLTPLRERWNKGELPLVYGSIGSQVDDVGNFTPEFFGKSERDLARDDEVAEWLRLANRSSDEAVRREYDYKALRKVASEAYALPLFSDNMNFVMSQSLSVVTDSGGAPHFYRAKWK